MVRWAPPDPGCAFPDTAVVRVDNPGPLAALVTVTSRPAPGRLLRLLTNVAFARRKSGTPPRSPAHGRRGSLADHAVGAVPSCETLVLEVPIVHGLARPTRVEVTVSAGDQSVRRRTVVLPWAAALPNQARRGFDSRRDRHASAEAHWASLAR